MTDETPYRHRFSMAIIQHAVWLCHGSPLSCRDVQELLHKRGSEVSKNTYGTAYFFLRVLNFRIVFGPQEKPFQYQLGNERSLAISSSATPRALRVTGVSSPYSRASM